MVFSRSLASDAGPLTRFGDRHLGHFEFALAHAKQSAAAYRLAAPDSQENSAAAIHNGASRIGEAALIFWLQGKIAEDPFFVQAAKGNFVARRELAEYDLSIGHLHWPVHMV